MLDIKYLREHEQDVRVAMQRRGAAAPIDKALELDRERRQLVTGVEALKRERNAASEAIGKMRKAGRDASEQQQAVRAIGDKISGMDGRVRDIELELRGALLAIPNVPHASVPDGKGAADNVAVREWGAVRKFDFQPRPHVEIAEGLGVVDFARAARMTGAGFQVFVGQGARLERALIQFMLDLHTREHGYTEVSRHSSAIRVP